LRTAVLTDIHANLPALEAVIAHAEAEGVDRWVCLGDTVGYGAQPNECCERVRDRVSFCLLGNHDAAVAGRMSYEWYHPPARAALEWTRGELDDDNLAWLSSLPYTVREGEVAFCHGSPVDPEAYDYIFHASHARELLPMWEGLASVTFLGHAHLPRAFALTREVVETLTESPFPLQVGRKYVFAVGSVGQPRDGDVRSAYALFDDVARTVTYHRVPYAFETAAQRILRVPQLPPQFAQRLYEGA
jgi:diadenosine tetraphosphatase ApaH/serine/threonine PP2A family protein phosphatase